MPERIERTPERSGGCNNVTFGNRVSPLLSRGPTEPKGAGRWKPPRDSSQSLGLPSFVIQAVQLVNGFMSTCSHSEQQACRRVNMSERAAYLKRTYKLSEDEYWAIAQSQNYLCAVCREQNKPGRSGEPENLAVDHNHATGANRG